MVDIHWHSLLCSNVIHSHPCHGHPVVNTSPLLDFGFSPLTCFGQWDVSGHDPCRALECEGGWSCPDELLPSPLEDSGSCSHWTKEDETHGADLDPTYSLQPRPTTAKLDQLKIHPCSFKALSFEVPCYAGLLCNSWMQYFTCIASLNLHSGNESGKYNCSFRFTKGDVKPTEVKHLHNVIQLMRGTVRSEHGQFWL